MDTLVKIIFSVYGLGLLAALVLIVFLIFRRKKEKKSENFEKRDN